MTIVVPQCILRTAYFIRSIQFRGIVITKSCTRCLYDDQHPFGLTFDGDVCSGCITHQEKDVLDWNERKNLLVDLLAKSRRRARKTYYDCVIPVRGDAEDYYVVSNALELDLSPLLVCVNDYFMNDIGWHNLHNLITHFDLDSQVYCPEITTYKELVRTSFRKFNHMLWPSLALSSAYPVHVAFERNIPIVLWGQLQPVEQAGKFSHLDAAQMTKWSRIEHDLFGVDVLSAIGNGAEVKSRNLNYYYYPDIRSLNRSGIIGIYLSNYMRWDPFYQNSQMTKHGFTPEYNAASFDPYERAGSSVYYQIHDLMKFKRRGYRKCRDHLTREIRHGRLSREQAVSLEKHYSACPVDVEPFFNWLGVTATGKEWILRKVLAPVRHLIGGEHAPAPELPNEINKLLEKTSVANEFYLNYDKGIE